MAYSQAKTLYYVEVVVLHEIVNGTYRAVRAVFDRKDAVLAESFFHSIEYALETVEIHYAWNFKKLFAGSLRVRSGNTLTGDNCFFREDLRCFLKSLLYAFRKIGFPCKVVVLTRSADIEDSVEHKSCITVERFSHFFGNFVEYLLFAAVV